MAYPDNRQTSYNPKYLFLGTQYTNIYKVGVLCYFSNVGFLQEKSATSRKILRKDFESTMIDPLARQKNVSDQAGISRYQTPIMFIENQIWKCELEINI